MYFLTLLNLLINNPLVKLPSFNMSIRMRQLMKISSIQMFKNSINGEFYLTMVVDGCYYSSIYQSKEKTEQLLNELTKLSNDIDQIKQLMMESY